MIEQAVNVALIKHVAKDPTFLDWWFGDVTGPKEIIVNVKMKFADGTIHVEPISLGA